MQKTEKICIQEGLEHVPDFKRAEAGMCSWMCKLCGKWIVEWEDCQP